MPKIAANPNQNYERLVREYTRRIENLQRRLTYVTEEIHYVGEPGEPPFLNGWTAYAPAPLGFYKETFGTVTTLVDHLNISRTGLLSRVYLVGACVPGLADSEVFELPRTYRPMAQNFWSAANSLLGSFDGLTSVSVGPEPPRVRIAGPATPAWYSFAAVSYTKVEF